VITHALFALVLAIAAPEISIELAPDQPMPFVYLDEPLLIELQSEKDLSAETSLTVQSTQESRAWTSETSAITLREGSPYWSVYEDIPATRGYYAALFRIEHGGETSELRAFYSRVDRPYGGTPQAFNVGMPGNAQKAAYLLRHAGVPFTRVKLGAPNFEDALAQAKSCGLKMCVQADGDDPAALNLAVKETSLNHCAEIARWEFFTRGENGRLQSLIESVRAGNCNAPVYAVLRNEGEVRQLMQDGGHAQVKGLVAQGAELGYGALLLWNEAIREGGYESFELETMNESPANADPARFNQAILYNCLMQRAGGASVNGLDGALLYADYPGELFPILCGLAPQLAKLETVGVMVPSANVTAPVFRSGDEWCVAIWNGAGAEKIQLPVGAAKGLRITNAFNNEVPAPAIANEVLEIEANATLQLVWGKGGALLGNCARTHAGYFARQIAANETYKSYLDPALLDIVADIAKEPGGRESRTQFFKLIRSFPELEAQWHAGLMPRPVAVPAIAQLAALARHLCTLEELRGDPILEPMNDMLARARELQSLYLTGTVGMEQPYHRGEWLLAEVKRLNEEAESLAENGHRIEAAAVAALCEWRARALEFAAKAGPQSTLGAITPVALLSPR